MPTKEYDGLSERIVQGDEQAMLEFSIRYNWPLYGFIRRLGVHDAGARELTCTCITEILLKVKTHYKPGTNFEAWVFTVTRNAARGWLRKERRFVELSVDAEDAQTLPAAPVAGRGELKRDELKKVLETLDRLDREILTLRYGGFETPTFAQIAADLSNCHGKKYQEATIRQRHGRALTQLRHLLAGTTTIGEP